MTQPSPPGGQAALTRDLSNFLIELSIALHKYSMYPAEHPSLRPAADAVVDRLNLLLNDRNSLSLGVAHHQLVIEGVATDPKHPVLKDLANRLHRHHLGALTFTRGIPTEELLSMLKAVAREAERTGEPLGLGPPEKLRVWEHIRLYPVSYDRLELLHQGIDPEEEEKDKTPRSRATQLWVGLARAATESEDEDLDPDAAAPSLVARAIEEHARGTAYDQVIVGYLLQIAEELKSAGGQEAVALRKRMTRLIGNLRPETLRKLVEMGGDVTQRRRFALDAAHSFAVESVIDIVRAYGEAADHTISHSLIRMLTKLAAHADRGTELVRPRADVTLRDHIKGMITGWHLHDPNPDGYNIALSRMSKGVPLFSVAEHEVNSAEDLRLVQMALEVNITGPSVWSAMERIAEQGRLSMLFDVMDRAPRVCSVVEDMRARVATPDQLARLLLEDPVDFEALDRVISQVGLLAVPSLLDGLSEADSRQTRRGLLDRLGQLGDEVAPLAVERLRDPRWFVQRNMLGLLADLPGIPENVPAGTFRNHEDERVRREAYRLLFKVPSERDLAVCAALTDADERSVRIGLTEAHRHCPGAAVPLLVNQVANEGLNLDLRLRSVRVLGQAQSGLALEALLRLTQPTKRWLRRAKLPPKTPIMLAALTALASSWASDRRVQSIVSLARKSGDPAVRSAASPQPSSS